MKTRKLFLLICTLASFAFSYAQSDPVRVLAFSNAPEDAAQNAFVQRAVSFFSEMNGKNHFVFEHTSDPTQMNAKRLAQVQVVMMLNHIPLNKRQKQVFEQYMENGGRWLGFHKAAFYDSNEWPWFTQFIGGELPMEYSWPPLPAKLQVDDPLHPVCTSLPQSFSVPSNAWYRMSYDFCHNPQVAVLASLARESFPVGISKVIESDDVPVVWSNTKYRMVFNNMGNTGTEFDNPAWVLMTTNALTWLLKPAVPVEERVAVAYVISWGMAIPDPTHITHINYAFGHVNETFDGVLIDNHDRLREVVALKEQKPSLKVLLSIGGWGSGRFSEMVSDPALRLSFAKDCRRVADEFDLDGIDIDWEYPTNPGPGISHAPEDTRNFTLLMRDIRNNLPEGMLLTLATAANGKFIDFKSIEKYVDFVNIMTYDMASPPYHHSGLYRSSMTSDFSCYEAVLAHVKGGFPIDRLVLGIPFYGRSSKEFPRIMSSYGTLEKLEEIAEMKEFEHLENIDQIKGAQKCWDDVAKAPYLKNSEGKVICVYDNPLSIKYKSIFIHKYGMKGAMYWEYEGDDPQGSLRKAVYYGVFSPEEKNL